MRLRYISANVPQILVLFFVFDSFFLLKKPRGPRVTRWWGPRTRPRSMTLGRTTRYLSPYNYASFLCWIKRESEGCTYIVVFLLSLFHYLLACPWGNAVRSIIKKLVNHSGVDTTRCEIICMLGSGSEISLSYWNYVAFKDINSYRVLYSFFLEYNQSLLWAKHAGSEPGSEISIKAGSR